MSSSKPSFSTIRAHRNCSGRLVSAVSSLLLGWVISGNGVAWAQQRPPAPRPVPTAPAPAAPTAPAPTAPAPAAPTAPATPPPADLTRLITQLDQAASREDRRTVMRFYSNQLTHSDGLNYRSLEQALQGFWQRYANLRYSTVVNSWQQDAGAITAETTTTITGVQQVGDRTFNLTSTLRSRQRYQNNTIVQQTILSEQTRLTSGQRPPTLEINLPERITPGRDFNFDAIVQEPLGDRVLLGAALEEPIDATTYLNSARINLELLSAGGLFKVGRAPTTPGNRWLSAVIVRDDGITIETRRVQVGN